MTNHLQVDFQKILYPPEAIPEAFVTDSVPAAGVSVARYDQFSPLYLLLQNFGVYAPGNVETAVILDGRGDVSRLQTNGQLLTTKYHSPIYLKAAQALELLQTSQTGSTVSNVATRYTVTAFVPTLLDKIQMGIPLTPDESALAAKFELVDKVNAGFKVPRMDLTGNDVLKEFDVIKQTSKKISVSAGTTSFVDVSLIPPRGHMGVLLGLAVDTATIKTSPGARDTYIYIDRDIQSQLCSLDTYALPGTTAGVNDEFMRMFIPFKDKLNVRLSSVTGVSNLPITYFYGYKRLSYVDRSVRWPQIGFQDESAKARADEVISKHNLRELVAAGLPLE